MHDKILPRRTSPATAFLTCLAFAAILPSTADATPDTRLEIGGTLDAFGLRDTAGTLHQVGAPAEGVRGIVLAFSGVGCPIAESYAPRLEELSRRYTDQGVRFFGINSNVQDTVTTLRAFVNEFGLTFPLLKDHAHEVADQLGAERTTEVFLLDSKLRLRYRGRVDDQFSVTNLSVGLRKDHPEKEYLRDALDALLKGQPIEPTETEAHGCVIGRRPEAEVTSVVTFHEHVEKVFQDNCQSCHREGQIAPFPLLSYDDALGWSGMIAEVVENRRMPPWHASPAHGEFLNDRSLSDTERETILAWVAGGAQKGDPAKRPAPRSFPEGWQIEPDVVFEMPEPFEVPASGTVDYQYFKVRTHFETDRWVRGIEVRAGSRDVVHHILVFAVDPKNPREWRRQTRGGLTGYFGAMVPGERPIWFPDGAAKRLPAGATLIFQVHYTANGTAQADRSRIGLRFAESRPKHLVHTRSAFNDRHLLIPAGEEAHVMKALHEFKKDTELLSLLPHMHIRGAAFRYDLHYPMKVQLSKRVPRAAFPRAVRKRMRYDSATKTLLWRGAMSDEVLARLEQFYTTRGDRDQLAKLKAEGRTETLLDVPHYDFGWQSSYRLKSPLRVPARAVLECTAVYNNSASNPALTRELWSEDVSWGDQTWDEMLIGYFDAIELD